MVYKKMKRGGAKGAEGTRGGPNDKGTFKKGNRVGEVTAKRMQDKLGKLKQKNDDDEIKSNDSDDYIGREPTNVKTAKRNELLNDPFFNVEGAAAADADMGTETVEEKRLKMAN